MKRCDSCGKMKDLSLYAKPHSLNCITCGKGVRAKDAKPTILHGMSEADKKAFNLMNQFVGGKR